MDSTPAAASRRSTRKRRTARKHSYSPPPAYRKKVSDVHQVAADTSIQKKDREDHGDEDDGYARNAMTTEEVQKKTKKTIKQEVVESSETVVSGNEDDSGNYETSISELEDGDELPPQLYAQKERKSTESVSSSKASSIHKDAQATSRESSNKQNVDQSPSDDSVGEESLNASTQDEAPVESKPAVEKAKFNLSFIKDSLVALKKLNPELFKSALKKPIQEGDTLVVTIKLLQNPPTPTTSDTVVPFLLDAENESRKFVNDLPDALQKPRINLEKAWESIAITYGLFGPTVVPIILHFIKQQNALEIKYFNRPAALFNYTLIYVKEMHEHLMPLLSPQMSVAHSWILNTLEQPFLRSYLTLVQWVKYFEPRLVPIFVCDQTIEPYRHLKEFFGKFVSDPFSSFLTDLKRNSLIYSNKVIILLPLQTLTNDKLSLIALLFRGLGNIGCEIKVYSNEQDIIKECQSIKANNTKAIVFASEISLQQTHFSKVFGGLCFSFKYTMMHIHGPTKTSLPTKLQLSTTNSDGSMINEGTLVSNNVTPACFCRYYLEHITSFIEGFIKEQQELQA